MAARTRTGILAGTAVRPAAQGSDWRVPGPLLQRKCGCGGSGGDCDSCSKKKLQRSAGDTRDPGHAPPIVNDALRSSGQPLDTSTRAFMEPRFGHDFGHVRVHIDEQAAQSAAAVNALAFTVGSDIVFGAGQYRPSANEGRLLLAHELTHVVQQQGGVHRETAGEGESATSMRLRAIIEDVERLQARAGEEDSAQLADFISQLRSVADGNDEELKLSVLSGFSSVGIQKVEEQMAVREPVSEGIAAKSLDVSSPADAAELEADRVAQAVVLGGSATVVESSADAAVHRQVQQALAGAGATILAWEAASTPVTSWNPPGWVVLGVATLAAGILIGVAYTMSRDEPTTDTAEEDPCAAGMVACMGTSLADLPGGVYGSSRCLWCAEVCRRNGGVWPNRALSTTGYVRCDYWNPR